MGAITDVPSFQSPTSGCVPHPEMVAALSAHGSPLKQRRALSRNGYACCVIALPVCLEDLQVLVVLIPADVPGVGVWDAGQPILLFARAKGLLAIDGTAILSPP